MFLSNEPTLKSWNHISFDIILCFFCVCVKNKAKVYPLQGERLQLVQLIKETKHE
jgi:hypothetical protein